MRTHLIAAVISTGLLVGPAVPNLAAATQYHSYHSYRRHIRHKRHVNTAKRIGIGAAGGAGIGALRRRTGRRRYRCDSRRGSGRFVRCA